LLLSTQPYKLLLLLYAQDVVVVAAGCKKKLADPETKESIMVSRR
jgi:hypothetical protein